MSKNQHPLLSPFEQQAYLWAQGYCGYPDQLAAVISRLLDRIDALEGYPTRALLDPPAQPAPSGQPGAAAGAQEA